MAVAGVSGREVAPCYPKGMDTLHSLWTRYQRPFCARIGGELVLVMGPAGAGLFKVWTPTGYTMPGDRVGAEYVPMKLSEMREQLSLTPVVEEELRRRVSRS